MILNKHKNNTFSIFFYFLESYTKMNFFLKPRIFDVCSYTPIESSFYLNRMKVNYIINI